MSKIIITIICIIFLSVFNISAEETDNFVPGISDLPVPQNFSLKDDTSSVFYSNSGRIVEAVYEGYGVYSEIFNFYDSSLEALGWSKEDSLKYNREGEMLKISLIPSEQEKMEIHFSLKPLQK